jgi:hypothetical protein
MSTATPVGGGHRQDRALGGKSGSWLPGRDGIYRVALLRGPRRGRLRLRRLHCERHADKMRRHQGRSEPDGCVAQGPGVESDAGQYLAGVAGEMAPCRKPRPERIKPFLPGAKPAIRGSGYMFQDVQRPTCPQYPAALGGDPRGILYRAQHQGHQDGIDRRIRHGHRFGDGPDQPRGDGRLADAPRGVRAHRGLRLHREDVGDADGQVPKVVPWTEPDNQQPAPGTDAIRLCAGRSRSVRPRQPPRRSSRRKTDGPQACYERYSDLIGIGLRQCRPPAPRHSECVSWADPPVTGRCPGLLRAGLSWLPAPIPVRRRARVCDVSP